MFFNYNSKRQALAHGLPLNFPADPVTGAVYSVDTGAVAVIPEDRAVVTGIISGTPPVASAAPEPAPAPAPTPAPPGPAYDTPGNYTIRKKYTTLGASTWTAPSDVTVVEYLVVGGGGGGGGAAGTGSGGGGGGGAVLTGTVEVTGGTTYDIFVGDGGTGSTSVSAPTNGADGAASSFGLFIAAGGQGGFESRNTNASGVYSRGGTAQNGLLAPGGGSGGSVRDAYGGGGGGGGAGGAGADGIPGSATTATGGAGGAGILSSITESAVVYGAGGAGGNENTNNLAGAAGTSNTGKGGGGAQATSWGGNGAAGGKGGSGIVVIAYSTAFPAAPPAPVITGTVGDINAIQVNFTQAASELPIINYEYALDGSEEFIELSPARSISPLTISGLDATRDYTIVIRAKTAAGVGEASNAATGTSYSGYTVDTFSAVGAATWTAPATTTAVQYLVVGGGGGGGGCYSDILDLGTVPFVASNPGGASTYWIRNAGAGQTFHGYMYKGSSTFSSSIPVRVTVEQAITPNGSNYYYNRWYATTIVYSISGGFPTVTNIVYLQDPIGMISSTYNNNHSAGSGGGAGGEVKYIIDATYPVTPGSTYAITVGGGGAGGAASVGSESVGISGEASSFDTIVARGGSGGSNARKTTANADGFKNGGEGGQGGGNIMAGRGGDGAVTDRATYSWNTAYLTGTAGGIGRTLNFDGQGNKTYGAGGNGGSPSAPGPVADAVAGLGKGGSGVSAELNSYTGGAAGGSGIVMLKYYY